MINIQFGTAEDKMEGKQQFKEYRSEDLIVYWNLAHCSHSGKCTGMLPQVFDMKKKPWISMSGAEALEIIKAIDRCPSGALRYELTENSKIDPELAKGPGSRGYQISAQAAVQIRMVKDGPLLVTGPTQILNYEGKTIRECESMVLCRCGKSKNPPFCDGSHMNE